MGYEHSSFHGIQTLHGLAPPEPCIVLASPSQALQTTALSHTASGDMPLQDEPLILHSPNVSNLLGWDATNYASSTLADNSDLNNSNSANRLRTASARDLFRSLSNGEVKDVVGSFLQSSWLSQNEKEPLISTSQEASGAGPISSTSIYILLISDGPVKRCKLCTYRNERADRVLAHLRSHFNHRPYPCNSACGSKIW